MRMFLRALRIVSAVTVFFFCWTYGQLYAAVAYAATGQKADVGKQKIDRNAQNAGQKPEEPFEKALEVIRKNIEKADEKAAKNEDATTELAEVKAKKTEIESLDIQLRKEFAATEKKLKDSHLPKEILDRHYAFVKHYEDNLAKLRANLAGVEQGAKGKGFKEAIEKAKLQLEKTKPHRKHVPLDPNNLPNRLVKAKAPRAPRLKKEEFEKEFKPQRTRRSPRTAFIGREDAQDVDREWMQIALGGYRAADSGMQSSESKQKRILVASNGPLTGLLSSDSKPEIHGLPFSVPSVDSVVNDFAFSNLTQNSELNTQNYMLAASTLEPPTSDDLAETPEVQFTQDIQNLAAQLNHNPVQIYNWVRNNIEYAPTYGSIQGADQCLQSKICNDIDTASLLIALLRVSGIYAHYVYGTIEVPIDKVMNWVGGVTNPQTAGTVLATNGIPATLLKTSSGVYKVVQMEHVWVDAFIDYIPSRGAVQRQGNMWIPLDASFKQYTYTQGIDIASAVPFDAQTFANQILSTATTNTTDGSVTNVNSAYVQQTMQDYQTQVQNYIQQNYPNATVGDVIGKKEIIQQNYPILVGTLPYKTVQVGSEFSQVPDNLRETMSFSIPDPTGATAGLTYTTNMAQIAGKKITLSFSPATANDEAVIESLLPQPNADGTPIDPSQMPQSLPAYLINLVPELRIDGQVVATGASTMMGSDQAFTMSLNEPGIGISNINNIEKAGEYFGIGVDTGRIGADCINTLKAKLNSTAAKLETGIYDGLTKENLVGDILYTTIASYFGELDASDEVTARTMNVIRYRAPSLGMFSLALNIGQTFGVPTSAGPKGMMIDVDRIMQAVFSKDGSADKMKQFMISSGVNSSTLEHTIPEELFSTATNQVKGISAVKILQTANDQGISVYAINQMNVDAILPQIQLSTDVKSDIQNAANAGKIVMVPKSNVTINGWTGCGYIIIDPTTGAGAYMISNGLNGGGFMYYFWTVMWGLAWIALIAAISILIVAFLPEITAALNAIGAALGGVLETIESYYLTASLSTFDLLESNDFLSPIFTILMAWAEYSPPPAPVPTTVGQGFWFFIETRIMFYYSLYQKYKNLSYYSIEQWKFALNTAILLKRLC